MLSLTPPIAPQLARASAEPPEGDGWLYERKWDGFRTIAFVDGAEVYLQSRNGRPLRRYFPEVEFPRSSRVLDGELVIMRGEHEDFEALQQRIHPAASRIALLAAQLPATFVAFDLLAEGDRSLLDEPFGERRRMLEQVIAPPLLLAPCTADAGAARLWLETAEGLIAKRIDAAYAPGRRTAMVKVKRIRTIDAVVVGWRPGKAPGTVGSLILGLHDGDGEIVVVGHTSGFTARKARDMTGLLAPYETGVHGTADHSRWSAGRDLEWRALRPELVAEVRFDHTSAGRIRHGAKLVRLRTDKPPAECMTSQLEG
ncbi:MAG TPA: ATP-dependent DNA ligase [Gaiellales bacterium]|nr:ATP-dependent DNA ligase [Gaiellales bacterium]